MSDLIDRHALIAEYDRVHVGEPGGARKLMMDDTKKEKRKTGTWNRYYRMHSGDTFICNNCGSCFVVLQGADKMYFCPNCGSDNMG